MSRLSIKSSIDSFQLELTISLAGDLVLANDLLGDVIFPPGDLLSDEPPLESALHREQIDLLIRLLKHWRQKQQNFYVSGNLTIYVQPQTAEIRRLSRSRLFCGFRSGEEGP